MSGQRLVRLALVFIAVIALSLGTTLTAANVVPPSNAGMASVPISTACPFPVSGTFLPKNITNQRRNRIVSVLVLFPSGRPPEFADATAAIELRLPGGTQTVSPMPGSGPWLFLFWQDDVFELIGDLRGDVVIEIVGTVGTCYFVESTTIRANGPV